MASPIKVIDLFAGPGGLGEGFSALTDCHDSPVFRIALSIEKEASAHRTLKLRAFYRQFAPADVHPSYYKFLAGDLHPDPDSELFLEKKIHREVKAATNEARQLTLGKDTDEINRAIKAALAQEKHDDWVLIVGPPCQAYSVVGRSRNKGIAGYRLENDERSNLYLEYLKIIREFGPAVFVMENVKGLLSARHNGSSIFARMIEDLRSPGEAVSGKPKSRNKYEVFSLVVPAPDDASSETSYLPAEFVIRSEHYGVPQARHRVILLGIRSDLARTKKPELLARVTGPVLQDVIRDLPELRSGLSRVPDSSRAWADAIASQSKPVIRSIRSTGSHAVADEMQRAVERIRSRRLDRGSQWKVAPARQPPKQLSAELRNWYKDPTGWKGVCSHESRGHIVPDLLRYLFCASYCKVADRDARRTPKADEFPRELAPAHANWGSGHFADRFRVQVPDKPATTVTSHISKDGHYFIHYDPDQCRSLTVREAARIQTFPDNYVFVGNRTQQYVQVGNAVPPYLAYHIARIIAGFLNP